MCVSKHALGGGVCPWGEVSAQREVFAQGCVSALGGYSARGLVCLDGVSAQGVDCPEGSVSAQGGVCLSCVCLRGVCLGVCGRHPLCGQNDRQV